MRTILLTLGAVAAVALVAATLTVGFGLYNVSARSGHLPGVSWLLHTTYRNAVRLRAPPSHEVPPLDDDDLIALGARHYDRACRVCYGAACDAAESARRATARAMVPRPPKLTDAVKDWPTPLSPLFPRLSGRNEAYLLAQLDLWRSGVRGGGPRSHRMRQVAHTVTEADARALAAFYAAGNP